MCSRNLDQLGDEIAELSAHVDAATARLLGLIREFDARGGWGNGFRSCAEWLSWRVGLDPGACGASAIDRGSRTSGRWGRVDARGQGFVETIGIVADRASWRRRRRPKSGV